MSTDTIDDLFRRLEKLNEIGAALSREQDIDRLLEFILVAAKTITRAQGGTLYRIIKVVGEDDKEERHLHFEILHNDEFERRGDPGRPGRQGGTSGNPINLKTIPLYEGDGENHANVAAHAALRGETVNIADAYAAAGFDFSGTRKFDEINGYRSRSFLTVPMRNHENEIIGVLQLINCLEPQTGTVVPFSTADQRLAESLASQAAIALTKRQLISQLEELFESFIKLINLAIDEKSEYTAGHCERVPELTMMLAEAASATEDGPLAAFHMTDRDRYELKIAGLLHDCGKVTTPVHVVDKATKLQTLYDRIHTLDTRFEVLKRDAEIEMLRKLLALPEPRDAAAEAALRRDFEARLAQLNDDRRFLRRVNIGGEFMKDADLERVRAIGKAYRWRGASGRETDFLSGDEIKNLSIRKGTLNRTERKIINKHINVTIDMLEKLPWPKHLTNVPEYAGGHHERMDGKGYPKGLTRKKMSWQARVMGIADIFEALTAGDRPYKTGKTLSESLFILGRMKEDGHIDPDLFDVFVRRGVYLQYAREKLDPQQIDEVDLNRLPGYLP